MHPHKAENKHAAENSSHACRCIQATLGTGEARFTCEAISHALLAGSSIQRSISWIPGYKMTTLQKPLPKLLWVARSYVKL